MEKTCLRFLEMVLSLKCSFSQLSKIMYFPRVLFILSPRRKVTEVNFSFIFPFVSGVGDDAIVGVTDFFSELVQSRSHIFTTCPRVFLQHIKGN